MPQIHLLTDDKYISETNYLDKLTPAILAGIDFFQLRFKKMSKKNIYLMAKALKPILKVHHVKFIINDHIDIALAIDACGVHLGQSDLPYLEARKILGPKKIIGLSVSSIDEFNLIGDLDCDYLGVGPLFHSHTKLDSQVMLSMNELLSISKYSSVPCIAIGGINQENCSSCIHHGASGIAVCAYVCQSLNPYQSIKRLRKACLSL